MTLRQVHFQIFLSESAEQVATYLWWNGPLKSIPVFLPTKLAVTAKLLRLLWTLTEINWKIISSEAMEVIVPGLNLVQHCLLKGTILFRTILEYLSSEWYRLLGASDFLFYDINGLWSYYGLMLLSWMWMFSVQCFDDITCQIQISTQILVQIKVWHWFGSCDSC